MTYGVGDGSEWFVATAADLDGDGDLDLAVANYYVSDDVYRPPRTTATAPSPST